MKKLLIIVVILAAAIRLWGLNQYPSGLNADEASLGYNAYSLLQTGKDEYGASFPLTFKSFGDYKPGLYAYFVMPFVAVLGLNEWAVRLPSALFGIGLIIVIYFLTKEIFKKEWIALLASLLLAITPWAIHFSRGGWETNAATFFISLGMLLFLKGLANLKLLYLSALSFIVSMYTYQSPRLIVPILAVALLILYKNDLFKLYKIEKIKGILLIVFTILLLIPLALQFKSGSGSARFQGLSYFSESGPQSRLNELRGEHIDPNSLEVKLLHNKITSLGPLFLGHYLDHFKPDFLFINGDQLERNKVPETGQFMLIESLFLASGLLFLIRNNFLHSKLLIAWILIAPIASSLTYQTPHALRALNTAIPLTAVMAAGLYNLVVCIRIKYRWIAISIVALILVFEFIHYSESYYIHYPKRYPLSWEYGFSKMVTKLTLYEPKYKNIVITDRYDQPYILVLFYKKYDPNKYQPQANLSERDKFNFGTIRSFDNYQFRSITPSEIGESTDTLFIGTEDEIGKNTTIIDRVDFPDGKPAFLFAESKK
jgi:4-amino-4-deoxy-L-arabinose transferase-like glycosyltransferase